MRFYITDSKLCKLLRPVPKVKERPIHLNCSVNDPMYNKLFVKSGKWTAKLHQVYDILHNEKKITININELKTDIRRYKIIEYIKEIEKFKFSGLINDGMITSPLLELNDNIVSLYSDFRSLRSIPDILYTISYSAQFLYRHFFSSLWNNRSGVYRYDVMSRYFSFRWQSCNIDILLNELVNVKLIKIAQKNIPIDVKIVKLL